uniref:Ig-like domain-containing protein n=1 Tax=Oryzias latipes TaxID=8090 RepID=A0A3B3HEH3_ORYLA
MVTVQHRMWSLAIITVFLLCSRSCFCESKTVEVQSGENVTLLCSDFTKNRQQTDWFRMVNSSKVSCISSMFGVDGDPSFCDGFDGGKFNMSSNSSSVSLKISGVDESDSGLYFCGFYRNRHTVIGDVTQLIIKGEDNDSNAEEQGSSHMVVVLAVKIRKLLTAARKEQENTKNLDSNDLNYAALSFNQKPKKGGRSPSDRELQPHVLYAPTRKAEGSSFRAGRRRINLSVN